MQVFIFSYKVPWVPKVKGILRKDKKRFSNNTTSSPNKNEAGNSSHIRTKSSICSINNSENNGAKNMNSSQSIKCNGRYCEEINSTSDSGKPSGKNIEEMDSPSGNSEKEPRSSGKASASNDTKTRRLRIL